MQMRPLHDGNSAKFKTSHFFISLIQMNETLNLGNQKKNNNTYKPQVKAREQEINKCKAEIAIFYKTYSPKCTKALDLINKTKVFFFQTKMLKGQACHIKYRTLS